MTEDALHSQPFTLSDVGTVQGKAPTCVVILDEAHCPRWPHAQEPWRPALAVYEPPVLPSSHGFLQYTCAPHRRHETLDFGMP